MNEVEFVLYSCASCMLLIASRYMPPKLERPVIVRAKLPKKSSDFPEDEFPKDEPKEPKFPSDDEVPF
jgi:hypothetical protein